MPGFLSIFLYLGGGTFLGAFVLALFFVRSPARLGVMVVAGSIVVVGLAVGTVVTGPTDPKQCIGCGQIAGHWVTPNLLPIALSNLFAWVLGTVAGLLARELALAKVLRLRRYGS